MSLATRPEAQTQPQVIAITSPYGSTGKTTVAINLAAELAAQKYRVLLIDADTNGPSIANYLSQSELPAGFVGALRIASQNRFDKSQLERLSVELAKPRFTLLPGSIGSYPVEINNQSVERILETAKAHFDFTVIDLGCLPTQRSGDSINTAVSCAIQTSVLSEATRVVLVTLADPVGISRFLSAEQSILKSIAQPNLIVNRLRNSVIPNAKQEIQKTLQRLAAIEVSAYFPDDPAHLDQATRDGTAASLLSRTGSFRQAIHAFTNSVILGRRGQLDGRIAKLG